MKKTPKVIGIIILIYLFLVSIKLMGVSFELFGDDFAKQLIGSCSNPMVGLFIGVLATSIIQSSSTTTSIVVGLVGGGVLTLELAIPIIMGANIGTTVTSTLVSLAFITRREDFRRAFAGSSIHDFFNMLSVMLFFPLEIRYHFIQRLALFLTKLFEGAGGISFTSPLKIVIEPVVHAIRRLLVELLSFPNAVAGVIMLGAAIIVLITSLVYLVKTMRSLVISQAEVFVDKYLFKNDFVALLLGMCLTSVVQSSSVTVSLTIPLIGAGILSLRRCYPYILGANIGTTCTAILASFATVGAMNGQTVNTLGVTVAFAHLMFNVCGICVFYPLKRIPIFLATHLAKFASESAKWAIIYVLAVFFLIPLLIIFITK